MGGPKKKLLWGARAEAHPFTPMPCAVVRFPAL